MIIVDIASNCHHVLHFIEYRTAQKLSLESELQSSIAKNEQTD